MRRYAFISFLALLAIVVVVKFDALYDFAKEVIINSSENQDRFVTIGTAGVTGVYYPTGGGICRLVNRHRARYDIQCSVESTSGSIYNLNALLNGELDLGIAQTDLQYHAYHQTKEIESVANNPDVRSVLDLYVEPLTIVVREDSGIYNLRGIRHKRVNIGAPGSGQRATLETLVKEMKWKMDKDFSFVSELNPVEQSMALCDDKVDAIVFSAGHPNGSIQEAIASCPTRIIPLEDPVIDNLVRKYPYYLKSEIPGGLYQGVDKSLPTFGTRVSLVSSSKVSSDVVYMVTKSVLDTFEGFKKIHPSFDSLTKEQTVGNPEIVPVHEGAIRYFIETGLMEDPHQKREGERITPDLEDGNNSPDAASIGEPGSSIVAVEQTIERL